MEDVGLSGEVDRWEGGELYDGDDWGYSKLGVLPKFNGDVKFKEEALDDLSDLPDLVADGLLNTSSL